MRMLVIKHIENEGPGTLGDYLQARGVTLETVSLHNGESLPRDADDYAAIVSMGGPMNVYEEDKYPFLAEETHFLASLANPEIPALGVCLGAQMIAKARGGKVTRSPEEEIGWGTVSLTEAGGEDLLFKGLPETLDVLQWHGDMFHIPEGGSLLASGDRCPHQAFRFGAAFGLQFHVEVDRPMLSDWFKDNKDLSAILNRYDELEKDLREKAELMYSNFYDFARQRV